MLISSLLAVSLLLLWPSSLGIYVGTALLPHGDFAYDPSFCTSGSRERRVADEIAAASRHAAQWVLDQSPDIVLLTTPHGLQLDYDYGIYHSRQGSGQVTLGQDLLSMSRAGNSDDNEQCNRANRMPYNVSIDSIPLVDPSVGNDLLQWLQPDYPVAAIYSPNDEISIPLYWGEIIPLLLLQQSKQGGMSMSHKHNQQQRNKISSRPYQPLIWTFPHRRYQYSPEMVPELLKMGAQIMSWIQQRRERIAVVISGDLSHTHLAKGPYGYSNTSTAYDTAIGTWLKSGVDPCDPNAEAALLELARSLQPSALSCGFTGYVMWHGMMKCRQGLPSTDTIKFQSTLLALGNVTYYGMCSGIVQETPNATKTETTTA
jgi:aromatic ring-opening dioxygenase LigB subunit